MRGAAVDLQPNSTRARNALAPLARWTALVQQLLLACEPASDLPAQAEGYEGQDEQQQADEARKDERLEVRGHIGDHPEEA